MSRQSPLEKRPMIVLASQSPARKRLLKRLGFTFKTKPADLDEDSFRAKNPRALVELLARQKARTIRDQSKRPCIVIGSDQMLLLGKRVFGKPKTHIKAVEQLLACSGKTVQLLTAVTVIDATGEEVSFTDVTEMTFRKLSREEIEAYVKLDRPLKCAGSFMFEKGGIRLFEKLKTDDPTAIEGLPCLKLAHILRHALDA